MLVTPFLAVTGNTTTTKIEAYEKTKPKKYLSNDGQSADWGVKQNTDGNKIAWFGYKQHTAINAKSELPVAIEVTPASVHDSTVAMKLVKKARANLVKEPSYYLMDSAYDSVDIYKEIMNDYHGRAIIPLNLRGAKEPREGFDFDGTPVCSAGFRMIYWGCDNGFNKFRCPHVLGKADCPFGSNWCSDSNYGLVVKTSVKDDPRLFCNPHRGTKNWQKLCDDRTGAERYFSRSKEHLGLERPTLRGIKKIETHAYLCAISLLATVLTMNRAKTVKKTA